MLESFSPSQAKKKTGDLRYRGAVVVVLAARINATKATYDPWCYQLGLVFGGKKNGGIPKAEL